MSGAFPTAGFTTVGFRNNVSIRSTESVNGITQRSKTGGQYWSFTLQSPPLERSAFSAIYSFLVQQDGSFESFTMSPPIVGSTQGTIVGDITATGSTAQKAVGSKEVLFNTTGGGTTAIGTMKAGDFIKFSTQDKIYMLTSDIALDGSTSVTVAFTPGLLEVIDVPTVTYNSVPFKVHLTSDTQAFSIDNNLMYTYQVEVREAL